MQPVYPDELYPVDEARPRMPNAAYDTSGMPVDPPTEGFQNLGQVYGTSTNNAYTAEQDRELARYQAAKMTEDQRAKVEQRARQYSGLRKVQQAIAGGAKPEEAVWLAADDLFGGSPATLPNLIRSTRTTPQFTPSMIPAEGGKVFIGGPNRAQFIADKAPTMPPDVKANAKILEGRLHALQTGPLRLAADPKEVADLENQLLVNSTNWQSRASAPKSAEAASPFKEGQTVRNRKDGKLYKIVNGQPVPE